MRVLRDVAEQRSAKEVTASAVARVMMARPRKPLVRAAYDVAAWIESHPEREVRDVVARYRRWLDGEPNLAALEPLPGEAPMPPKRAANVTRLPVQHGGMSDTVAGMLRDAGIEA